MHTFFLCILTSFVVTLCSNIFIHYPISNSTYLLDNVFIFFSSLVHWRAPISYIVLYCATKVNIFGKFDFAQKNTISFVKLRKSTFLKQLLFCFYYYYFGAFTINCANSTLLVRSYLKFISSISL